MNDLRSVQYSLDYFEAKKVLRINLERCKELKLISPECVLLDQAIKILAQTIADIEEEESQKRQL